MWKEVNLLSTNFNAKHTPSATLISMEFQCKYSTPNLKGRLSLENYYSILNIGNLFVLELNH